MLQEHGVSEATPVIDSKDAAFKGLSVPELKAWHGCLPWLREPDRTNS